MEKSFPFNAVIVDGVPDRVYAAEDFAAERAAYVSNGVTAADALTVSASGAGGMAVEIAAGAAVIDGYTYFNTSPLTVAIEAADAFLSRIDLAVLRLDLAARTMYCTVKTGIPAEIPTAPVCAYGEEIREMALAEIAVAAGESVIEQMHLTDKRVRADYILNRVEVDVVLAEYSRAIRDYFDGEDAARIIEASKIFRKDAGTDTVLTGSGEYHPAAGRLTELVRFTADGIFSPAEYPSVGGLYTVVIQGAGGSGGWGNVFPAFGGCAGAVYTAANLPLDQTKTYSVTVGKGGEAVVGNHIHASKKGADGGPSSFDGFFVSGGVGGMLESEIGTVTMQAAVAGLYTAPIGTLGDGGKGADSLLGRGGVNVIESGDPSAVVPEGYGAGGGSCGVVDAPSGAGGDGVVIVYGYVV